MRTPLTTTVTALALAGAGAIGLGSMAAASYGDEPPAVEESEVTVDETESVDDETGSVDEVTPSGLQAVTDDVTDGTGTEADGEGDGGCRGGSGNSEAVADALGLTTDELRAERDAGQSLAEIAASQGVEVDAVVGALVDGLEAHLAEEVAEGDLTQEEADERLAGAEDRANEKVNAVPGEGGPNGLRAGRGDRSGPAADA